MKLINGNNTKSICQWNFGGGYFRKMQVLLTAMKGQKVQELTKKENSNIFEQAFQIVTQFPYNIQNGMLYR